jgi:CRP/FNR family transcriptional regulator, cyclic AMP receptor protein
MASAGDPATRLGRLGVFADLTEPELHEVAAELGEQSFPEGVRVLQQGDHGTGLFIIVDGEVGVVIDDEERATLATGSFFGEVSVLLDEPVTADIVVRRPLRCLVIPPARAEAFLMAHPTVMYRMLQIEARRLRTVDPEHD